MSALRRIFGRWAAVWLAVRGEDSYVRYLRHASLRHDGSAPMSRKEFFKAEQARRWNGVRRCC